MIKCNKQYEQYQEENRVLHMRMSGSGKYFTTGRKRRRVEKSKDRERAVAL
jgi:hypothetical protein